MNEKNSAAEGVHAELPEKSMCFWVLTEERRGRPQVSEKNALLRPLWAAITTCKAIKKMEKLGMIVVLIWQIQ